MQTRENGCMRDLAWGTCLCCLMQTMVGVFVHPAQALALSLSLSGSWCLNIQMLPVGATICMLKPSETLRIVLLSDRLQLLAGRSVFVFPPPARGKFASWVTWCRFTQTGAKVRCCKILFLFLDEVEIMYLAVFFFFAEQKDSDQKQAL